MTARTHFDVLGLPRRYHLDSSEVERNYLARSRELHPDYHQLSSTAEQRASLEMTAALNEANATLRDPFRRAEYLLHLEGGPSASERKEMAPAFLEEMLDLRMEIEELREGGSASAEALTAMEQQLLARRASIAREIEQSFAAYEALPGDAPARSTQLVLVRQWLNAARYIQGLLRDLRAE